ncbi:hypothetical protein WR25_22166 [Diploscapter pachys]|uniref:Uncharacterized protein n=1 Tax=Diploscapter pachys TaxID=2018661 RepID=A0A2A2JAR3_9BILA|nr:hypothetical protein WR25_22166 [Diploscapter pachys]
MQRDIEEVALAKTHKQASSQTTKHSNTRRVEFATAAPLVALNRAPPRRSVDAFAPSQADLLNNTKVSRQTQTQSPKLNSSTLNNPSTNFLILSRYRQKSAFSSLVENKTVSCIYYWLFIIIDCICHLI